VVIKQWLPIELPGFETSYQVGVCCSVHWNYWFHTRLSNWISVKHFPLYNRFWKNVKLCGSVQVCISILFFTSFHAFIKVSINIKYIGRRIFDNVLANWESLRYLHSFLLAMKKLRMPSWKASLEYITYLHNI